MGDIITAFFSTPILLRALIVGVLVSLCAALLGVSLVLKRYSMIGDGLSHVGFGALAVAAVMNWAPMAVAVPVVIAAAFLLLRISGSSRIKGDSAIALISTGALAIGVMAVSMSGMNSDLDSYQKRMRPMLEKRPLRPSILQVCKMCLLLRVRCAMS